MYDSLGDRMKGYENIWRQKLPRKTDVIIRVDGKAFHTYTKGCKKPFDQKIMDAMVNSALKISKQIQGFNFLYAQSDEVSFYFNDKKTNETDAWFDNNIQKIVSVTASSMTAYFNKEMDNDKIAIFDARVFILPNEDEVANAFLWRCKDWYRNSMQMYCQSLFSHNEMNGKKIEEQHNMLHSIGKNWTTDLTPMQRNGSFGLKDGSVNFDVKPEFNEVKKILEICKNM